MVVSGVGLRSGPSKCQHALQGDTAAALSEIWVTIIAFHSPFWPDVTWFLCCSTYRFTCRSFISRSLSSLHLLNPGQKKNVNGVRESMESENVSIPKSGPLWHLLHFSTFTAIHWDYKLTLPGKNGELVTMVSFTSSTHLTGDINENSPYHGITKKGFHQQVWLQESCWSPEFRLIF